MTTSTDADRASEDNFDVVEEASTESFPASDAPGWAIGRAHHAAAEGSQGGRITALSATAKATPEERSLRSEGEIIADTLSMPQEDDPAGDGHMWSGKADDPEERAEDDVEIGASVHIPAHDPGPTLF